MFNFRSYRSSAIVRLLFSALCCSVMLPTMQAAQRDEKKSTLDDEDLRSLILAQRLAIEQDSWYSIAPRDLSRIPIETQEAAQTYAKMLSQLSRFYKKILFQYDDQNSSNEPTKAVTIPGKIVLANLLADEKNRQKNHNAIISRLKANPALTKELRLTLTTFKEAQKELTWFWQEHPVAEQLFVGYPFPFLSFLHESELGMELWHIVSGVLIPTVCVIISAPDLLGLLITSCLIITLVITFIPLLLIGFIFFKGIKIFRQENNSIRYIHQLLKPVHTLALTLEKLQRLVAADEQLRELLPEAKHLATKHTAETAALHDLLEALTSSTFDEQPGFFSNHGRILASFKLMQKHKHVFIQSLELLGQLDAYAALAQESGVQIA